MRYSREMKLVNVMEVTFILSDAVFAIEPFVTRATLNHHPWFLSLSYSLITFYGDPNV